MPLKIRLKFFMSRNYWWILSMLGAVILVYVWHAELQLQVAVPVLATLLSVFYFLQKQKVEEIRLFREIFAEFNKRYDDLNDKLALIHGTPEAELDDSQKLILMDYFNLCGEEYFYFMHGFIFPDVWNAWRNGILSHLENPLIRAFWDSELDTNSYYGMPKNL